MTMFETHELDKLSKDLLRLANDTMPKECRKFIQREGNKLKRITLSQAKSSVKKKTGRYFKSIKRGRTYKYSGNGAWAVRVYSNDNKAHLIEKGHRIVSKDKKEHGFYTGRNVFEKSKRSFENTYNQDVEQFIDNIVSGSI